VENELDRKKYIVYSVWIFGKLYTIPNVVYLGNQRGVETIPYKGAYRY
jgi:hypothetical protein